MNGTVVNYRVEGVGDCVEMPVPLQWNSWPHDSEGELARVLIMDEARLIGLHVDGALAQTLDETKADWRLFD
jgi:hypothetical protein